VIQSLRYFQRIQKAVSGGLARKSAGRFVALLLIDLQADLGDDNADLLIETVLLEIEALIVRESMLVRSSRPKQSSVLEHIWDKLRAWRLDRTRRPV
jgi:hypothetical protein